MKQLKVICNKFIPFPGFGAMQFFGIIFRRQEYCGSPIGSITMNHEGIHLTQALDFVGGNEKLQFLGFIVFYMLYFIEWLIKLIFAIFTFNKIKAYYSISFEQEAYYNQRNLQYQESRKKFSWTKYIFKFITDSKIFWK